MNNEKLSKWMRIILPIAGILVTIGIVYAKINNTSERVDKVEIKADTNQMDIVELKTDVKYIIRAVDKNADKTDEILKELKK